MFNLIQTIVEIYLVGCGIILNMFLFFSVIAIYKHLKDNDNE